MAKSKSIYICSECGQEYPKWNGRCNACGAWNTLEETIVQKSSSGTVRPAGTLSLNSINSMSFRDEPRYPTGMKELDRVLGGGLVKGSLVLLGGDPGIGKSTLLLQICNSLAQDKTVLYISGEESERQIKLRADRLGVNADGLYISACTDCDTIIAGVKENRPDVVIIDSIQTMKI